MLVKTFGSAVYGINATTITVEVNCDTGTKFFLVGLPDNAVKESQQRLLAAFKNVGYRMPGKKIVVNMAPADIRKEGSAYDLTIAMGILAASAQIPAGDIDKYMIMGELSLDGNVAPIRGALPITLQAAKEGYKGIFLPIDNAAEAGIVSGIDVYGVSNIREVIDFFETGNAPQKIVIDIEKEFARVQEAADLDFSDVKGQESIKRALEIAAAGGHNVILIGPPGAGKTMLARRLPTILPPLTVAEALETTKIHSVAGKLQKQNALIRSRPFRSPHHTISDVALVGGGSNPQPGEISLAHNGVLFLDELPEFKRTVLEVMRQPMEERKVSISRARLAVDFPASFMLVASMNPCPCGFHNHPEKPCLCGPGVVQKYLNKISGPLLDRIDLHVEVTPVSFNEMSSERGSEKSESVRERVINARAKQAERFKAYPEVHCNAQMSSRMLRLECALSNECKSLLKVAVERIGLSGRAYDRILKVARTIADLDNSAEIGAAHLAEAIQYRSLDREGWSE